MKFPTQLNFLELKKKETLERLNKARSTVFKLAPIVGVKSQEISNGLKVRKVFTNVVSKAQELNDPAG